MFQRKLVQTIQWIDIESNIMNEESTIEWRLFGKILLKRQIVLVTQKLPNDQTGRHTTPGFKAAKQS